jgi:hypothetical protein
MKLRNGKVICDVTNSICEELDKMINVYYGKDPMLIWGMLAL